MSGEVEGRGRKDSPRPAAGLLRGGRVGVLAQRRHELPAGARTPKSVGVPGAERWMAL